ncbi:hypothetical protein VNO77_19886 [Canavalia gladiata]|uniref:Uncharacterized protein n=1 Tax=Canavalia gladiata TaxID=3824 RepID=A0AAN9QLV9_CANGL
MRLAISVLANKTYWCTRFTIATCLIIVFVWHYGTVAHYELKDAQQSPHGMDYLPVYAVPDEERPHFPCPWDMITTNTESRREKYYTSYIVRAYRGAYMCMPYRVRAPVPEALPNCNLAHAGNLEATGTINSVKAHAKLTEVGCHYSKVKITLQNLEDPFSGNLRTSSRLKQRYGAGPKTELFPLDEETSRSAIATVRLLSSFIF